MYSGFVSKILKMGEGVIWLGELENDDIKLSCLSD